jgi:hypothetical protein
MTDKPLQNKHKLTTGQFIRDRQAWILDQARGCKVVHLGCTDEGYLEDKLDQDMQLHTQLANVCLELTGIDIDTPGIQKLRSMGYRNLICRDIADDHEQIIKETAGLMDGCELVICGEVLEHVLNYGKFLAGVRELALAFHAKVLITVPNTFSLEGFVSVVLGVEDVHPDHKCYFSQITLHTLLNQTGFRTIGTYFYTRERASTGLKRIVKRVLCNTLLPVRPQLAEGLITVAVPEERFSSPGR